MFTEERQNEIAKLLSRHGRVVAAELAAGFGVSEDTVRRDLRELARAGRCVRVYGGALARAPDTGPLAERVLQATGAKARLASAVAGRLADGETLFIDAGSTNLAIAAALPRQMRLTVVTNAPSVAVALASHENCTVSMLPGIVAREKGACVGARTVEAIRQVSADLFVIGTCGIDPVAGVTALDAEEAEVKRAMQQCSRRLLVAATTDKLGTAAPFRVADAARVDELVVDADAPAEMIEAFTALGAAVTPAEAV